MSGSGGDWQQHLDSDTRLETAGPAAAELLVPGLTILCHPDARRIGERVALTELAAGREALLSRVGPVFAAPGDTRRRPLADPYLSRHPIRLSPTAETGVALDCTGTKTPVEVNGEPVDRRRVLSRSELERGVVLLLGGRITLLVHPVEPLAITGVPRFGLVGESSAIVAVRQEIAQVADLDVPVLVRGETGTGKELVARGIHQASPLRARPFQAVNIGAIPASLAAAELFGSVKGAYTGANRRRTGYFSRAEGGTLLLDEIGEMPGELQVMLLRALETGEIQPVGAESLKRVEVRILAATDADLESEVAAGRFRPQLLHRLSGFEIRIPPLRQRLDDLGRLLVHFLVEERKALGGDGPGHGWPQDWKPGERPWLPAPVVARLATFSWPGNVRQLKNVARQLVIGSRGAPELVIRPQLEEILERSPPPGAPASAAGRGAAPVAETARRKPATITEEELAAALRSCRWDLKASAEALSVSRTSLYALIAKFPTVRAPGDISAAEIEAAYRDCGGDLEAMVERLEISPRALRRRLNELDLG